MSLTKNEIAHGMPIVKKEGRNAGTIYCVDDISQKEVICVHAKEAIQQTFDISYINTDNFFIENWATTEATVKAYQRQAKSELDELQKQIKHLESSLSIQGNILKAAATYFHNQQRRK